MLRTVRIATHCLIIASLVATSTALATAVNVSGVRSSAVSFSGMAVDAATGEAYELTGYGPGYGGTSPTTLTRYDNAAAFEAGTPSGTVTSTSNLWGTYIAAQNGNVFGRASTTLDVSGWPADAKTTKISGTTGATQLTVSVAGMDSRSFDWGGASGVSAMNDGTHLYIVGGAGGSSDWRITSFDYDLNQLNSVSFSPANQPGWAFAINNHIFFGEDFNSGQISTRVNATTGAVDAINFTLTGFNGGLPYMDSASYDAFNDTLYLHSAGVGFYKVSNAAQVFAVPEPEAYAMMLAGLVLVGAVARRKKQAET